MSQLQPPSGQQPQQPQQQKGTEEDLAYYESRRGQGWEDPNNMKILTEWIHYAAVYLDILSEATEGYRKTLRMNTIINLIVSTLASTLSVSTFNTSEQDSPRTALTIKIVFTILTFILTIAAGYIKVYQIQEKLENSLRLKQEWALFGSKISSEMQLPLILRKNAIFLISTMKGTYLDLVKSDMGIKKDIIRRMATRSGLKEDDLTLSELFERIIKNEVYRLQDDAEDSPSMSASMEKRLTALAESYGLQTPQIRRQSRSRTHLEADIAALQAIPPPPDSISLKISTEMNQRIGQPACAEIESQTEQLDKINRAMKEAEMIKSAFATQKSNDIVEGVKGFFNKLNPNSETKTQKESNARQLLADRGKVSSFLRSAPRTQAIPRNSITSPRSTMTPGHNSILERVPYQLSSYQEDSRAAPAAAASISSADSRNYCISCGEHCNDEQSYCAKCSSRRRSVASSVEYDYSTILKDSKRQLAVVESDSESSIAHIGQHVSGSRTTSEASESADISQPQPRLGVLDSTFGPRPISPLYDDHDDMASISSTQS